jgi:excisionase family DNA binding protein
MSEPRLLTVAEVAKLLNVSVRKVWGLLASNKLKRVKLGKRTTRVRQSEVDRIVEEGVRGTKHGHQVNARPLN